MASSDVFGGSGEFRCASAPVVDVEWRTDKETGDGSYTLSGYAAVFDQETTLYDGQFYKLRERVAPGAFTDVLGRGGLDCHLVIGHNMDLAMARIGVSGRGGMEITQDDIGLRVFARLNPKVSYVADLAELMRDGVVDQMSFAFTIAEQEMHTVVGDDGVEDELRVITRVGDLFDVTVTPRGAYPQTQAFIRSQSAGVGRGLVGRAGEVSTPAGGGSPIADAVAERGGEVKPNAVLFAARLNARRMLKRHNLTNRIGGVDA